MRVILVILCKGILVNYASAISLFRSNLDSIRGFLERIEVNVSSGL